MADYTFWHNSRCSTARKTLALLEERGVAPAIRFYLDDAPTAAELQAVAARLPGGLVSLVRWKEPEAAALKGASDATLIAALAANPRLIERPVLIGPAGARVGRPPESVLELL